MSKSVPTILGFGAVGAILLSLMMKHLVEVKAEREDSPYAAMVESRLGSRLVGRVRIDRDVSTGGERLRVRAVVLSGLDLGRLARVAGREVWTGALRSGRPPSEVRVVLVADDGDESVEVLVPPPAAPR
ncbi:MAG TPA: hypothetical protein ENI87_05570 [bacterium]|nr:hypothetical protein [bacterium]